MAKPKNKLVNRIFWGALIVFWASLLTFFYIIVFNMANPTEIRFIVLLAIIVIAGLTMLLSGVLEDWLENREKKEDQYKLGNVL